MNGADRKHGTEKKRRLQAPISRTNTGSAPSSHGSWTRDFNLLTSFPSSAKQTQPQYLSRRDVAWIKVASGHGVWHTIDA